ncbi:MAG: TolC family protein [Niabella sp.]
MKNILKALALFLVIVQLQSCFVGKKYQRPEGIASTDLFRKEYQKEDTANIAFMEWRNFFTDEQLQQHISYALDSNFDFNAALENIKIARATYLQSNSAFLPGVNASLGGTYVSPSLNTQTGRLLDERTHQFQYDITGSLSWEADIWGKLSSAKRAAFASLQGTIAARQALQTTIISNLASMYYQLLILDEQKKITAQTIEFRKKSLETTQSLKEAGTVTEVAVQQSKAQLINTQALLVSIDNQITVLENSFNLLLGKNPGAVTRSELSQQRIPATLSIGVPYQLLSNRPDVRAAEYNFMNAFELTNVAKSMFYPSLTINASTGLQSVDFDKLFSAKSWFANAVGSLTQPIWNKRQLKTQHEIRQANQEIAYLNYRKAVLTAGREVSDALANYDTQSQLETLKAQEQEAYHKATEYSQELLIHGWPNTSYLEVLTAQQNELNAELASYNATYGKLNAVVQLYKALGGGWK